MPTQVRKEAWKGLRVFLSPYHSLIHQEALSVSRIQAVFSLVELPSFLSEGSQSFLTSLSASPKSCLHTAVGVFYDVTCFLAKVTLCDSERPAW